MNHINTHITTLDVLFLIGLCVAQFLVLRVLVLRVLAAQCLHRPVQVSSAFHRALACDFLPRLSVARVVVQRRHEDEHVDAVEQRQPLAPLVVLPDLENSHVLRAISRNTSFNTSCS